ncbi:MAG: aminotransferase class V-fold PLP-dependent enzyme [Erysipelotrichaceae bacterium]|nr:aminotransferase class V-fold PLP-dependent enzyme [Erysipelotrichaceae bacterium]MDD3809912.1 aminotransferase class V-fold PLP-dependent enzyme [Erysipelotrichaceae bacterium]
MATFVNDYSTGCHPRIMQALMDTNELETPGYGLDLYCQKAAEKLKILMGNDNADVHFLAGGTQTNATFIKGALRVHQGVIACDSAHIAVHEAGAIEATGHKVITVKNKQGKLTCGLIDQVLKSHLDEHMVQPKMVYISQTTEYGTFYSDEEIKELYNYCQSRGLLFYIDGARLVSALAINGAASLQTIASNCDAFYFGGTKAGLLFGECLVIINRQLQDDFRYVIKQSGAMMAKGRILGVQFLELFSNELYLSIGRHENAMANMIKDALVRKGYEQYLETFSNQLFFKMSQAEFDYINEEFEILCFEKHDDQIVARIVTSYATTFDIVNRFIKYVN